MSLRNQLILSSAATALMLGGLACGYPDPAQDEYLAACGDGIVEGGEQCDDGNLANDDACTSSCKLAFCGDGFVHGGVEVCDDGNVRDGDACNASCSAGSGCGNGVVDPGEACDDGNQNNSDACVGNCVAARCGDGFAQLGVEQCDDGNDVDADGCNNTCTLSQQEIGSCPGLELPVSVANSTSVVGTTQTAEDSAVGSCGGAGTPDVVYAVVPKTSGWLNLTLTGINGSDPLMVVRHKVCGTGEELACVDDSADNGTEVASLQVEAGETYYVHVDSGNSLPAQFSLNIKLQDEMPGDSCPGTVLSLQPDQLLTVEGNTESAGSDYKGTGWCDGSKQTKELVYSVTPSKDGTLTIHMAPTFDGVLYARVGSCSGGMQVACSDQSWYAGGPEAVQLDAVGGTTYSVFADGYNGESGTYELSFHLEP